MSGPSEDCPATDIAVTEDQRHSILGARSPVKPRIWNNETARMTRSIRIPRPRRRIVRLVREKAKNQRQSKIEPIEQTSIVGITCIWRFGLSGSHIADNTMSINAPITIAGHHRMGLG